MVIETFIAWLLLATLQCTYTPYGAMGPHDIRKSDTKPMQSFVRLLLESVDNKFHF